MTSWKRLIGFRLAWGCGLKNEKSRAIPWDGAARYFRVPQGDRFNYIAQVVLFKFFSRRAAHPDGVSCSARQVDTVPAHKGSAIVNAERALEAGVSQDPPPH